MDLVSWTFSSQTADIDKPLLIDSSNPERSVSFNQLRTLVRQLISGLTAVGVEPGDCVCVNGFNDILYSALYLGIIGAGARFTGVNPAYTVHELVHHLQLTKAKILIVEPKLLETTLVAAKECGLPRKQIYIFDIHDENTNEDLPSWNELLQHGELNWVKVENPATTVASYASTSGTSGLPKAAMLSHSYHVSQAALRCESSLPYEVRRLTALPPFHVFATPIVPASIRQGHPTYIMRRFDMSQFILAIEQFRITETYMPPPVLVGIPQSPLCTKDRLQSLRQIWMGGAAVKFANQVPLYNMLSSKARINQVWGMTEAGWVTAGQWTDKTYDDSVGRVLEGLEVKLVDDAGAPITNESTPGDLLIRSPHLMLGYINNAPATRDAFTPDGWLRSGDVGMITAGKVYVIDRKKELIKVRGWQVSPTEVESTLLQHPDIVDAAVIGVPAPSDGGVGEVARAYLVCRPGMQRQHHQHLSADAVRFFAGQTLARYKIPEEVVFVEAIPKNSTGKILRRVIREEVAGEKAPQTVVVTDSVVDNLERRPSRGWGASLVSLMRLSAPRRLRVLAAEVSAWLRKKLSRRG